WSVDVVAIPDVAPMLEAAARTRAAGADVVVASLHCCLEYDNDATAAQEEAVRALLASPDVDLVLGHHAHVVQPFLQADGEWAALGLGNHIAEH
ncbi:CapA family protein, partial [Escherichia coli]